MAVPTSAKSSLSLPHISAVADLMLSQFAMTTVDTAVATANQAKIVLAPGTAESRSMAVFPN